MGLLGTLLERFGLRRRLVEPLSRPHLGTPVEPLPVPAPRMVPAPAPPPTPVPPSDRALEMEQKRQAREQELQKLHQSFQSGIVGPSFRSLDVDLKFADAFGQLVARDGDRLVLPPAAAFDVMRLVDDSGYPVKRVAAAIACDPALAGSVLSLANSPLHRGIVVVDNLPTAIVRLGQRHLKLLLLEIALHATRVKGRPFDQLSTLTWKHSLLTAQLAHQIAKTARVDSDHAYMAGLFHDVGVLAVLTAARKLSLQQSRRLSPQTLLLLIQNHAEALNEKVIRRWHLPEPVILAVSHSHDFALAESASALAAVTSVANDLCKRHGAWTEMKTCDLQHHPGIEHLGIDPALLPSEEELLDVALKIEKVAHLQ